MAIAVEQLTDAALALPSDARALLADRHLGPVRDAEIQALWLAEATRRRDEICSGAAKPIDRSDALGQVRRAIAGKSSCLAACALK